MAEKKHLVIFVHGIGEHDKDWAKVHVNELKTGVSILDKLVGFDSQDVAATKTKLQTALDNTTFKSITYDNLMQKFVYDMSQDHEKLLDFFANNIPELKKKIKQWSKNNSAKIGDFVKNNLTDLFFYMFAAEHRQMIRTSVIKQIRELAAPWKGTITFIAHSLGTAVLHHSLHQLAETDGSLFRRGGPFKPQLMMLCNTSALIELEYPVESSVVWPFIGPWDQGSVLSYVDIAHRWDPVCQLVPFHNAVSQRPQYSYQHMVFDEFLEPNIHAFSHYLQHPKVLALIYDTLYGNSVISKEMMNALRTQQVQGISPSQVAGLVQKYGKLIPAGRLTGQRLTNDDLVAIATFLKEVL